MIANLTPQETTALVEFYKGSTTVTVLDCATNQWRTSIRTSCGTYIGPKCDTFQESVTASYELVQSLIREILVEEANGK